MNKVLKVLVAAAFVAMVAINALANLLPLNQITTGQVSDSYPNLFTPAPFTFSIWGLIYLLLGLHVLYLMGVFGGPKNVNPDVIKKTALLFSVSSLLNTAWIFAWHYLQIPLTMVLMAGILICLLGITHTYYKTGLKGKDILLLSLPFSVYFGWITVATIANATVLLVSLDWNGFGIAPHIWTVIILFTGVLIGSVTALRRRDAAYGLVILWAYTGILIRHLPGGSLMGAYPAVYWSAIASLALAAAATARAAASRLSSRQKTAVR